MAPRSLLSLHHQRQNAVSSIAIVSILLLIISTTSVFFVSPADVLADTENSKTTSTSASSSTSSIYNFFDTPDSIHIGTPKIIELDLTKDKIRRDIVAARIKNSRSNSNNNNKYCSTVLHFEGNDIQPGTKYEARVSFAGTPPVKYDLETFVIPHTAERRQISASGLLESANGGGSGGADYENRAKSSSKRETDMMKDDDQEEEEEEDAQPSSNRVLLDTERSQFTMKDHDAFEFTKMKSHRDALLSMRKEKNIVDGKDNIASPFEKDFVVTKRKVSSSFFYSAKSLPTNNDGNNFELEETFLCVRASDDEESGVPSENFAKLVKLQGEYKIRFVVTVDRMLFGVLPMSAIPSVFMAVFYVVVGVFGLLPRILRAI